MAVGGEFLGRGWKFPPQVDQRTGRFQFASYEEDIKESIYLIMMTRKGERVMMPDFGCHIHKFMFANIDFSTLNRIKEEVKQALILWEPRIVDLRIEVDMDADNAAKLNIHIQYTVRATNNPFNLVYPFFLEEGIEKSIRTKERNRG